MFPSYLNEFVTTAKRVLLLQGPHGPFFAQFATWLTAQHGCQVYKLNFNGGDELFFPNSDTAVAFQQPDAEFPLFLERFVETHDIDAIVCFGAYRTHHSMAKAYCLEQGQRPTFWVFEEGYLRPDYITFERQGVNAHSLLSTQPEDYWAAYAQLPVPMPPENVASGFKPMAVMATRYYIEVFKRRHAYPHYVHHREHRFWVYAATWVYSGLKKLYCTQTEKRFIKQVNRGDLGQFFVVPLQVHNDSQVKVHCDFPSVAAFLRSVLFSFSRHAPSGAKLVIKHHPMDRGAVSYRRLINKFIKHYNLQDRVFYVFDVPLPVLMRQGAGMVLLNSTSGLSAMIHHMPVKVLGHAHYDMAGLTDQQPLADFWGNPQRPNSTLFNAYRLYQLHKTQINGNFYGKVVWPMDAMSKDWVQSNQNK
ncbi:MAG: capsule polysaccharide modification protein [Neisseriaceae bacterium]|nr:capsule polysaccharide modification protein [Neisseriaceae bacterium]